MTKEERAQVIDECIHQATAGVRFGMSGPIVEDILGVTRTVLEGLKSLPFDPEEKRYRMIDPISSDAALKETP